MATICRECKWHYMSDWKIDCCSHGHERHQITGAMTGERCSERRGGANPTEECPNYEVKPAPPQPFGHSEVMSVSCMCGYDWPASFFDPAVYEVHDDAQRRCPKCGQPGYYLRRKKETTDGCGRAEADDGGGA